MKVLLPTLSVFLLILIPAAPHAGIISFEDLAPRDSWGNFTDGWGNLPAGYQGFDWSADRSGDPLAGTPRWASREGYMMMPGAGGYAYVHTREFSLADGGRTFDVAGLTTGSYYHSGQDVHVQAWKNSSLKYSVVFTVDKAFQAVPVTLDYRDIDRFALWAGDGGTLVGPAWATHEMLIDEIFCDTGGRSSPIPEPSTLLIIGAGLSGLAWMCRKFGNENLNR